MNVFTPAVNAFRFYDNGTESGANPLAAQNTNVTVDLTSGDAIVELRVRIDETGGADDSSLSIYDLQYSVNGGAYASITARTGIVHADDTNCNLTDRTATTDRATNGVSNPASGSFVAGTQVSAPQLFLSQLLTASNFTEHVFGFELDSASLNDGDTIDFRITLDSGAPGMTNTVTPRITIQKGPSGSAVFSAAATATVAATGMSIAEAVFSSASVASQSLVGTGIKPATLAASGVGALTTTGQALTIAPAVLSASATSTMSATGAATGAGVLAASGTAILTTTGRSTAASVLAAAAAADLAGTGRSTVAAVLGASAQGILLFASEGTVSGVLSASGAATLSGVGRSTAASVLSSSANGTLSGVGEGTSVTEGVLASASTSSMLAEGTIIQPGVLSSQSVSALALVGAAANPDPGLVRTVQYFAPGRMVVLYELSGEVIGATPIRFTTGALNGAPVQFGGFEYFPIPVEMEGFEWNGRGPLPQPSMRVANIQGIFTSVVANLDDLLGCRIRRIRTFEIFLDTGEDPDVDSTLADDVYYLEQRKTQNHVYVEFSTTSLVDQEGVLLPREVCLKDICSRNYRKYDATIADFDYTNATCPYNGASYFDSKGVATDKANDRCGKRIPDCEKRFGVNKPLPTTALPGLGEQGF